MRYLVLSDLHGNLEALDTVLSVSTPQRHDAILVLGDLVGYGADPNAVIDRVRALKPLVVIRGNHDKVASGIEDSEGFNAIARNAVHWTLEALTERNREFLAGLPAGPVIVDDLIEICHGSPFDEDAYVFDELDALRALRASRRPACIFGHTHVPVVFQLSQEEERLDVTLPSGSDIDVTIPLEDRYRYLINPGSVGQPRDGDPRAAYAILDSDAREVTLCRVTYPVETAQEKVLKAGLPDVLAHRLGIGR
jgi:predicted phosphodiesterase